MIDIYLKIHKIKKYKKKTFTNANKLSFDCGFGFPDGGP